MNHNFKNSLTQLSLGIITFNKSGWKNSSFWFMPFLRCLLLTYKDFLFKSSKVSNKVCWGQTKLQRERKDTLKENTNKQNKRDANEQMYLTVSFGLMLTGCLCCKKVVSEQCPKRKQSVLIHRTLIWVNWGSMLLNKPKSVVQMA